MSAVSGVGTDFDWAKIVTIARDRVMASRREVGSWTHDNREGTLEYWTARVAYEMLSDGINKQVEAAKEYQKELQKPTLVAEPWSSRHPSRQPERETPEMIFETVEDEKPERLTMDDLRNGSEFEFKSLENESFRTYTWAKGELVTVTIEDPVALHVSESGGHRILDGDGVSHYIPKGWILLSWEAREGENHFDF